MHGQFLNILFSLSCILFNWGEPDIYFSGNFHNASFDEFVIDIERQSGAHFYYVGEWTAGITITASGDSISL